MTPQISSAVDRFVSNVSAGKEKFRQKMGFTFCQEMGVTIDGIGKKFVRISTCETSLEGVKKIEGVFCFIEVATGNILKPATYKAPEKKNPRGNVLEENCLNCVTPYGTVYVRGPMVGDTIKNILSEKA